MESSNPYQPGQVKDMGEISFQAPGLNIYLAYTRRVY